MSEVYETIGYLILGFVGAIWLTKVAKWGLRDYFAAKAMQALLRQYPDHLMNSPSNEVACDAYSMADAMLKAREA